VCVFKADLPWFIVQTQPHPQRSQDARFGPDGRCDSFQRPPGGKRISRLSSFAVRETNPLGPQSTASAVASFLVADGAYVLLLWVGRRACRGTAASEAWVDVMAAVQLLVLAQRRALRARRLPLLARFQGDPGV
jgi:hypothetical protein